MGILNIDGLNTSFGTPTFGSSNPFAESGLRSSLNPLNIAFLNSAANSTYHRPLLSVSSCGSPKLLSFNSASLEPSELSKIYSLQNSAISFADSTRDVLNDAFCANSCTNNKLRIKSLPGKLSERSIEFEKDIFHKSVNVESVLRQNYKELDKDEVRDIKEDNNFVSGKTFSDYI